MALNKSKKKTFHIKSLLEFGNPPSRRNEMDISIIIIIFEAHAPRFSFTPTLKVSNLLTMNIMFNIGK